jgi:hypothetical protein
MWYSLRTFLIRLLGGHAEPVERTKVVQYEKVDYRGLGRPFDLYDWEKLATMYTWGEVFFRFLAHQLQGLDQEEASLKATPEYDREALTIRVRRACILDLQRLPDTAAAKVVEAMTRDEAAKPREKGLNNNGK